MVLQKLKDLMWLRLQKSVKFWFICQEIFLYQDLTVEENLEFFRMSVFNTSIQENYDLIKDIYSRLNHLKTEKQGNFQAE